jgi:AraC-like DNA-binding protein
MESPRTIVACYREFAPHPALRGRVRAFFTFGEKVARIPPHRRITLEAVFGPGDPFCSPLFADGNSSIVFHLGTTYRVGGAWLPSADGACGKVIGAMSRVYTGSPAELPQMIGAYFEPAQAVAWTHVTASDLTDRIVELEDLWGPKACDLSTQLNEVDEAGRIDRLESTLLARMDARRKSNRVLDVAGLAQWVLHRHGRTTVESVASTAGISRQYLTRVFRDDIGISPKRYCRLARFKAALGFAGRGTRVDWARAAIEMGYADQSHMIAEFREFSSLTPQQLAVERWFHPFIDPRWTERKPSDA